ncbi:Glucose-methanol-choline oxidoreductase [Penicillium digitatum]|uniref:glucose oxidase n=1 Tax=Penicillium digitatum TaxID=36651 RepID=A0A7T6XR15_PENDI|nr:Glucose-methanol-choline oxidoreductase [Penicillium digitatum]
MIDGKWAPIPIQAYSGEDVDKSLRTHMGVRTCPRHDPMQSGIVERERSSFRAAAHSEADPTVLDTGDGPLSHYAQAFVTWAKHAFLEIGLQIRSEFQSGALLGQYYGLYTINATTMHRESSKMSFLRKGLADPNLTVFQSALAKRIRFHGAWAVGFDVETMGYAYTLSARKEIVLSVGAFQSPRFLMVSGVGPAVTLKAHGSYHLNEGEILHNECFVALFQGELLNQTINAMQVRK